MHKPKDASGNETHEILSDFKIQTDLLIITQRLDLLNVKKKENLPYSELCCPSGPKREN